VGFDGAAQEHFTQRRQERILKHFSCRLPCNILYCRGSNIIKIGVVNGHGPDHMVVGFTTTYAISAYHCQRCEFESRSKGVLDTTLCDKVCQ